MADPTPRFTSLSPAECDALLARHHTGRLGFTFRDRVDIEPITYAVAEDWIYGRTAPGTKLTTLAHHPWVAFEVDEIDGDFDWRSVVVHGAVYLLTPELADAATHDTAVALLREIDPRVLTSDDPAPERTTLFRIHMDEKAGRRSETGLGM